MNENASRRSFLQQLGATSALATSAWAAGGVLLPRADDRSQLRAEGPSTDETVPPPTPTADSCIFIWLGGGACHIDTWDPKRKGDPKAKQAGSYYDAIPTAMEGVQVCQHLHRMAPLLDRTVLMRSVHHEVIDEHAAAVNRVHTGRPPTGTTVYPSIGSVVAHQLGARGEGVPAYVVMGYPSASRGPGFRAQTWLHLPYGNGVWTGRSDAAADVNASRQQRRERLLKRLQDNYLQKNPGQRKIEDYVATSVEGLKLAGPQFMSVFDLKSESERLRGQYGGEFGQRCLLARRLIESGVRFVEVSFNLNFINGTGWDTHNDGQLNQHIMIDQLDQALAALILDLEKRGRLDRTLIVVATEFGRPPEFDGGGGRGHYSKAFSMVLAGGGIRTGQAIGTTDELGKAIVDDPISIPDFHATMYAALGVDHAAELYDGVRPVPITDHGHPVAKALG